MATNNQKITVELNKADRQLLKQLIKVLNANRKPGPFYCGNGPDDEHGASYPVRFVESEGNWPDDAKPLDLLHGHNVN